MNKNKHNLEEKIKPNMWALTPLAVFLLSYVLVSVIAGDFTKVPITVAFLLAAAVAVAMSKRAGSLHNRIDAFCQGAANSNILLMVFIFILAGAFAQTTKDMGSVDATVNLALSVFPPDLIAPGVFAAACAVSLSIGTSVGTIVALAPVAIAIALKVDMSPALMAAIVVSGAMFGDNLSFISDTTIVATRTQGCKMTDKFKANILIALPAAIVTAAVFYFAAKATGAQYDLGPIEWVKVVPYLFVLIIAMTGVNVMLVLFMGIVLAGLIGIFTSTFTVWGWTSAMGGGISNMGAIIIITLFAGGTLELMRLNGGIAWIIEKMTAHIKTGKGAELSIAGLVTFTTMCTANNTIAIIMAGPIAKDIAKRFNISPIRSASILDIFACVAKGIIPYGSQVLLASSFAKVSPIEVMPKLYYMYLLGFMGILAILSGFPKSISSHK